MALDVNDYIERNSLMRELESLYEEKQTKIIEYRIKKEQLNQCQSDLALFDKYDIIYNTIRAKLQIAIKTFEEERLELLVSQVEIDLEMVFPNDNFTIKFVPDVYRNTPILKLFSGHKDGKMQPTRAQHGRMCRQIIGLSITANIQLLLGCEILFLDEPLNSGDSASERQASEIIRRLTEAGYQIIYTEHKHEAYNELPRREIHLKRDLTTNTTKVDKVIDFNI